MTSLALERGEEKKEIDETEEEFIAGNSNAAEGEGRPMKTKQPSILPAITPELLEEHAAQQEAVAKTASRQTSFASNGTEKADSWLRYLYSCFYCNSNHHDESSTICGIPLYLFMLLAALVGAVIVGTVIAVIYYDPADGVQPPEYPSPAPSISMYPTYLPTHVPTLDLA